MFAQLAGAQEQRARPPVPATAYLFSYFVGNGEDGLHLAWSRDGYQWDALNEGRSFLKPEVGESKLMRDPCLLREPDGTFHLVWTTSWKGKTIGYANSKDLIHWSPQQAVPVMAHEPEALNCWAPEIVWDERQSRFLIFWATTIPGRFQETTGKGDEKYNHRLYSTTTTDFKTFTPTRLFYDPGFNVIDATLLPAGGRFHLIIKDETASPPKKHLRVAIGDSPEGPFQEIGPPFTRDWVEGPSALKIGDDYLVYFDAYRDHRYEAMRSRDLKTWEDVTAKISFPKGARHGTALAVPGEIVQALRDGGPAANKVSGSRPPRLFLIGDSTVKTGRGDGTDGLWGWGDFIGAHFDRTKLKVENRALGGCSSRTYLTDGLWHKVLEDLQPGDFVTIQFGHNDAGSVTLNRARASLKGSGEESVRFASEATGETEVVHTYGWYLRKYVADAKGKGATPIILSPVPRNLWQEGKVVRAANDYSKWAAEAAQTGGAFFIDLNEIVARRYETDGQTNVAALYFTAADHTHTTRTGAQVNAACVVEGIKQNKLGLVKFLADHAGAFDPARPGAGEKSAVLPRRATKEGR